MKKKFVISIIIFILCISWVSIAYADYASVAISFDKPEFCIAATTADDGGSGKYMGLGYSFILEGHLESDGEYEVDSYTCRLLGVTLKQGEADPEKG